MNSASATGSGLGEDPVRPSWEPDNVPSAAGGARRPRLRRIHWAMFFAGNLISVAVVVVEISKLLDVRVDDCVEGAEDIAGGAEPAHKHGLDLKYSAIITLISGLVFQVYFSTTLSLAYRSPLDIKSVHKLPPEALVPRAESFNVYCLAPFSLAWICLLGFSASVHLSENTACDWKGGSWLGLYLLISGFIMMYAGVLFYLVSLLGLGFSLTSPPSSILYLPVRKMISERILSNGVFFDVIWRLQGVVWVYRAGGFGLELSVFVGVCSVVGVVLTVIGSVAPDVLDRSPGDGNTTILYGSV